MATKKKIAVIAAIAALSYASPALAQSFNRSDGTGNELPSYYDSQRGLHAGITDQITKESAVSDQLYLLLQVWLIIVLTVVDGGQVLIQHPEWLQ